jgi:hypothetical protein
VAAAGFLLSALIALIALQAFPNSGDEYGYNYLASTFLHGRLWNQPWPADLQDVFRTYYIADLDGKRVSQYPPGWPGVLALFRLVHLAPLANACLGLAAAGFLWLALRRLRVPDGVRLGCFLPGVLAPFALFTNASYFNHTLTAVALAAIIWLDLRDTDRPALVNRAGIGLASSVLLTTRYETFLIAFVLLVGDRLLRAGRQGLGRFLVWGLPAALAALPITTLFLLYNWQVTGHPFETTLTWASPDTGYGLGANGIEGPHSLRQAFSHTVRWIMEWLAFVPVLMLPLYALALWRRVADRSLRWFDLILPVVVLFFFFYPDSGGFQYGPRYWYFGFVPLPVTVAAGLAAPDGFWRIGRWRLEPVRLAAIQLATCAGFTLGYALFLHLQTEVRMLPLRVAATAPTPALVLIPDVAVRYLSWQATPAPEVQGMDYTRNGLDGLGPLLLGRDLGAERTADLCRRFADRHVFRLVMHAPPAEGHLEPACR